MATSLNIIAFDRAAQGSAGFSTPTLQVGEDLVREVFGVAADQDLAAALRDQYRAAQEFSGNPDTIVLAHMAEDVAEAHKQGLSAQFDLADVLKAQLVLAKPAVQAPQMVAFPAPAPLGKVA